MFEKEKTCSLNSIEIVLVLFRLKAALVGFHSYLLLHMNIVLHNFQIFDDCQTLSAMVFAIWLVETIQTECFTYGFEFQLKN